MRKLEITGSFLLLLLCGCEDRQANGNTQPSEPPTPKVKEATPEEKQKKALEDLASLRESVMVFEALHGRLPDELSEVPGQATSLMDPWGRPYLFDRDPTLVDGFVIISEGPNKDDDVDDLSSRKR
ncbi:MAG: hypothetical protein H6834_08570 [Planctomycetes bacterium]|nr:hypothetical protein [Planctomycetota bacterium]